MTTSDDAAGKTIAALFSGGPALPGLLEQMVPRLLWAQTDDLPPGAWNHDALASDFWRLYWNDAPGGFLTAAGGQRHLDAKTIYLIPPAPVLSSRNTSRLRQFFVHFDVTGILPILVRGAAADPIRLSSEQDFSERVAMLGRRVEQEGCSDLAVQCLLMGMLYEALGLFFGAMPAHLREIGRHRLSLMRPLLPALAYLQDHLGERLTNAALAALCGMSEDYFIRRFREAVGLPPAQYIVKCRVSLAAQRLLFSEESIEKIAEQSGFSDRCYLSRVFTRQTGRPPAAYRRGTRT